MALVVGFVRERNGKYWLWLSYTTSDAGPADDHETVLFRSVVPAPAGRASASAR